jgi:hypothetical protein
LTIAFIHQPWSIVRPPVEDADAVVLVTEHLARRLARRPGTRVICYCRQGPFQPRVEHFAGVEYRRASVALDHWVNLGMQGAHRPYPQNPHRPFFSSPCVIASTSLR